MGATVNQPSQYAHELRPPMCSEAVVPHGLKVSKA